MAIARPRGDGASIVLKIKGDPHEGGSAKIIGSKVPANPSTRKPGSTDDWSKTMVPSTWANRPTSSTYDIEEVVGD